MNTKIFTSFLLSLIINFSFAQNQLKVATYNIQGMRPGSNPATRIQQIIELFKTLDPDLIGLQEINATSATDNQAIVIANALSNYFNIPYYYYYQKTHDAWDNQFKEYVGIVSKYEFKEQGYLDLTPGIFPRKVVWGLFDTSIGKINFFNTHLSYYSAWVNEKEIDEILNFAGVKMAIQGNNNAIIVGDFNATPDTPSYLKMMNAQYTDTYTTINPNLDGFTAPYPNPSIKIDYIFVNSYSDLVIEDSYLFGDRPISQGFYCSDHLGILTTFSNSAFINSEDEESVPQSFILSQNYPNPFNPNTTINFTVIESSIVNMKIFDVAGKEVAELGNETYNPGDHSITFNGSNLSNGIYFYRLSQGDKSEIRKMLLVK